jgi:hypothetical protein
VGAGVGVGVCGGVGVCVWGGGGGCAVQPWACCGEL